MEATHNERSKMIGRQKQERAELEKKVKKLKGAMKEAAHKELEELEKKHEEELAGFDSEQGTGNTKAKDEEEEDDGELQDFPERNWNGLSKKELEECCVERGLGKKGGKEDLIQKLIIFHQDLKVKKAAAAEAEEERLRLKKEKKEKKKAKKEKKAKEEAEEEDEEEEAEEVVEVVEEKKEKKKKSSKAKEIEVEEEEEEAGEEEEDEEDSDDDEDDGLDVDEEEMERQAKREKAVQQALKFLLTQKCPDGFPLSEFEAKLEMIKVSNFNPEKLGYRSIEQFVKRQPPKVLQYDKAKKFINPPQRRAKDES